ncbi:MAG TPA: hypothetical protein DHW61_10765 [Lachnoclostridium phytofermentans]|uniref:Uncharacterized protein n=1 Tax=Lachnoclostridium phytofermentans TaxID=66219 RepID=A0A3D2X8D4_9FIRM|nr:hypothetical protein [Lachnoclostridium phytofermentans]
MVYSLFSHLYNEALQYDNLEMYIAERGWQDWMDNYPEEKIADILEKIYSIANTDMREIRNLLGLSRPKFFNVYRVPVRTLEDWEYEKMPIPVYTRQLIAYTVFMEWRLNEERVSKDM